jgi:hypothetical protein
MSVIPLPTSKRRIAGFWMADETTLAYQVEDAAGDRLVMEVEFATAAEARERCAETIRAITDAVRSEGLLPSRKAAYLSAVADLVADWVVAAYQYRGPLAVTPVR